MDDEFRVTPRQIWAKATTTSTKTYSSGCTPFVLPSDGIIHVNHSFEVTLTRNAVYEPICTGQTRSDYTHVEAVLDTRDPFYSSVTPQLYAIGCCTVVSYVLVIILLITPRTFFVGGPGGGGANFLGRHGMMSGSYGGNSSIVGVGGRPWLQKVAALLVAVSLTIATVDSFRVAEAQYEYGYSDAEALSEEVIDGMEIRIVRVISQTFLWLAQVQTLIRLFPRHKEKVMIKWAGFALIVLDTIFSILENFFFKSTSTHPRLYDDAIPALSYLFELALNLLYAAWVIFYSISKHRYAFFHPKMRNICFVALLSFCAILIPVVFFVTDIAKPEIAGWGTYIRWVGSAAASVVVWEWVERIEALERDETKDGILGREVFDGDEMLEMTPSEEVDWPRYSGHDKGGGNGTSSAWGGVINLSHRPLRTRVGMNRVNQNFRTPRQPQNPNIHPSQHRNNQRPTPPPAVITPVSRTDTSSAPSTVYNVRYHPVTSPTPPVTMPHMEEEDELDETKEIEIESHSVSGNFQQDPPTPGVLREQSPQMVQADPRWRNLINHFRRRRASLPREVAFAQAGEEVLDDGASGSETDDPGQPSVQARSSNNFFMLHRNRLPGSGSSPADAPLPVTVIPARRRGQQTWSPQPRNGLLEASSQQQRSHNGNSHLPVRVIPSQPQESAPWDDTDLENGQSNYVLRYDPEAAALVHDHVSNSREEPIVTNDRASWTQTTCSEAGSHHGDGDASTIHDDDHGHLST
ncbi:pH-response regulator protein palH/RIM21 [Penicillium herquei]|nr:pH-response regulator protein palH/RIM21 [Penicillium herquei]